MYSYIIIYDYLLAIVKAALHSGKNALYLSEFICVINIINGYNQKQ